MHFLFFLALALILHTFQTVEARATAISKPIPMTDQDRIVQKASEAFIYGYPLVLMEASKNIMTNTAKPDAKRAPVNQLYSTKQFVDASFHDVVSPNNDTLYTSAWFDLSKEPIVLHIPDSEGRYFLMPILDAWTNIIASPGTRTTGNAGGDFAIIGPNWSGEVPDGIQVIRSPTNTAWMIGRIQTNGPKDYPAVHKWQEKVTLTPLSFYGKPYTPQIALVNPKIDMTKSPIEYVDGLDITAFYNALNQALVANPPGKEDSPGFLDKIKKIGVGTNETFDLSKLDDKTAEAVKKGFETGKALLNRLAKNPTSFINGWDFPTSQKMGNYGTDYILRAKIANIGLGANQAADAVYAFGIKDDEEDQLNGKHRYVIHFDKGQTPPAKAFWSLTMYNDKHFFVDNPLNRYALHYYDDLQYNDDGSLDIYLQKDEPEQKKNNWLPAPEGDFNVILRIYWPEDSVLTGKWKPSVVKLVN